MGLTIRWREEKNLKKIFDFLIHLGKYGLCSIAYIKNECGWRAILNTNEYSNKGGGGLGGGGGGNNYNILISVNRNLKYNSTPGD